MAGRRGKSGDGGAVPRGAVPTGAVPTGAILTGAISTGAISGSRSPAEMVRAVAGLKALANPAGHLRAARNAREPS